MSFQRRILHHGVTPDGVPQILSLSAVRSCWFELHRQGGCGAGQLVMADSFDQRDMIELGDWISFEVRSGERWYLGKVEERTAELPAKIRYRLQGMSVELNQIFPGGFGPHADGRRPHRYGAADLFTDDPDNGLETYDFAGSADEIVRLLMTQYVSPSSRIDYVPEAVETPEYSAPVTSLKLRGEESVRSLIKDLALRAQSASWGVDAQGQFFFLKPRTDLLATYRESRDLTSLSESRDVEFLFNRLLLTGDYVYDRRQASADVARRVYRWRGNYFEPNSRAQFGDRRLKAWVPWIRTQGDSLAFAREFFRAYSRPQSRYFLETVGQTTLPLPWMGVIRLESREGNELIRARVETLRVLFDHLPQFRMELGPEDPRTLWPEPPQDERWELPNQAISAGGIVSQLPPLDPGGGGGGGWDSGSSQESTLSLSFNSSSGDSSSSSEGSDGSEGTEETNTVSGPWNNSELLSGSEWSDESSESQSESISSSWDSSGSSSGDSHIPWTSSGYGGFSFSSTSSMSSSSSLHSIDSNVTSAESSSKELSSSDEELMTSASEAGSTQISELSGDPSELSAGGPPDDTVSFDRG